jgi:DnaJ-class molecular chaperone
MTHYKTLGIENNCSETEIKQAYRSLSFKYHPDRNKEADASEKMQQINEAYETLSDKQKRKQYDNELNGVNVNQFDQMINEIFNTNLRGMHGGMPPGMAHGMPAGLHHMFNQGIHVQHGPHGQAFEVMFSNDPHSFFKERVQPPPILEKKVEITFEDSFSGNNIPIVIDREMKMGNMAYNEEEKVYLPIQQGIDDGEILMVKDKGNMYNDVKGDLKIYIHVKPHPDYERKGLNIIQKQSISFKESVCGFERVIKHLDNTNMRLVSSRGNIIQNGDEHYIKGKGFTRDSKTGDLIIIFKVIQPKTLTDEELKLFDNILL